ncbi:MAG: glycosyltransferase family 4 protein [Spirulina sp. SIO3F2]|nr:glycosyltransferase family 4 protein [Spirulina sp. SIO3F2]
MRILVASHTYIVDLNCAKLRSLAKLGAEVTVIVPQCWRPGGIQNRMVQPKPLQEGGFRRIPLPHWSQNNQGLLTFKAEIIPLLRRFRPQIIHVEQGAKALGYSQLITLNKLLRIRAKNCFFTWWNLPYTNALPVAWLERYNLANTHGLIAGNQDGLKILHDHGYRRAATVLPQLGVDETLFRPAPQPALRAQLGIPPEMFVVGFVGRFVVEKGLLTLIRAMAGLTEQPWRLLLLGRGPIREELQALAGQLGIGDRLIWVESVPHDAVPRYINVMNTLVLPSETNTEFATLTARGWKEQFGHVLIEAMACKIPVIGSDSGEIPHVIDTTGLVFPEGNIEALRDLLARLISQPSLANDLGERGYQRVQERYTNDAIARQQLAFYQQLWQ